MFRKRRLLAALPLFCLPDYSHTGAGVRPVKDRRLLLFSDDPSPYPSSLARLLHGSSRCPDFCLFWILFLPISAQGDVVIPRTVSTRTAAPPPLGIQAVLYSCLCLSLSLRIRWKQQQKAPTTATRGASISLLRNRRGPARERREGKKQKCLARLASRPQHHPRRSLPSPSLHSASRYVT